MNRHCSGSAGAITTLRRCGVLQIEDVGVCTYGDPSLFYSYRRATHRAIQAVTDDIDALRFNRAVAQVYSLANAIMAATDAGCADRREALETLVLLIAPMTPHLAESCWKVLGHSTLVADTPWPKADGGSWRRRARWFIMPIAP